jgi:hypothetical protein
VVLADDHDFADVAVLLDLKDDPDVDDVVEEALLDLGELFFDEVADVGRDLIVAAGNLGCH